MGIKPPLPIILSLQPHKFVSLGLWSPFTLSSVICLFLEGNILVSTQGLFLDLDSEMTCGGAQVIIV